MEADRVEKERRRLNKLINKADLTKRQRDALAGVIENIAWQRVKLEEARAQLLNEDLTCEYDNGGGQTGTRENPKIKSYVNLWRAYMVGVEKFTSYLAKDQQDEATGAEGLSVLDQVRQMKKANT